MNASGSTRNGAGTSTNSTVITLRVAIAFSLMFVFMFVVNHSLISKLGSDQTPSKIFVTNRVEKFKDQLVNNTFVNAFRDKVGEELEYFIPGIGKTTNTVEVPPPVLQDSAPVDNGDSVLSATPMSGFHDLKCPHADLLKFWKPVTPFDLAYKTPYTENSHTKYVTFEPDEGGWNNIRMQMELVLVFAFATGRTLVLPPDQPMYLLTEGKGHQKEHSFADFFPFDYIRQRLPVITMEDFLEREAKTGHLTSLKTGEVMFTPRNETTFSSSGLKRTRLPLWWFIRNVSACPDWKSLKEFVVIPPAPGMNVTLLPPSKASHYKKRLDVFAAGRAPQYYDEKWHAQKVVHFITDPLNGYRLLEHFYTFIHFEDEEMDRYYKRFVRDYIHYIDTIFCKSALIVHQLLLEGEGSYAAFHIRRGEFQYKVVKISAEEMLQNVGQFIPQKQLVFIATDEKNKSFFNAFHNRYANVRYLNDFMDSASLHDINPNYLGMIDQVICSRGSTFVGTWFSTFSGYITRMRGYLGYSDYSTYYGDKGHRDRFQHDELPMFPFYMREWNVSWDKIDEVHSVF